MSRFFWIVIVIVVVVVGAIAFYPRRPRPNVHFSHPAIPGDAR